MTDRTALVLASPLEGWCAGLDDSPDAVFRERLLGDGVSIDPTVGELRAPFDGEVLIVPASKHAVNLRAENGAEILVHVGIDTVGLNGEGFEALVAPGERVASGQPLLRFDLAVLARQAVSCRTPVLLLQQDRYRLERLAEDGPIEFGAPLLTVHENEMPTSSGDDPQDAVATGSVSSTALRTGLSHGIHARPAAGLGAAIEGLGAEAVLVTAAGARGDVRSPVALMGLGVAHGDPITLEVWGAEASQALGALLPLLEPLPESAVDARERVTNGALPGHDQGTELAPPAPGQHMPAQVAAPGLAIGPAWRLRAWTPPENIPIADAESEQAALDKAVDRVRRYLASVADSKVGESAAVAVAHLALLDDPGLARRASALIETGQGASVAWGMALTEATAPLAALRDPRMQERCDDLEDLSRQVQRVLTGEAPGASLAAPVGAVVLAENLLPSQLLALAASQPAGLCLSAGGATSHVAILAASRKLPMLVAAGPGVLAIPDDEVLCLDAEDGALWRPGTEAACNAFRTRMREDAEAWKAAAARALEPAVTRDGVSVSVLANLASIAEAEEAVTAGAEGCGLLRTEFLYMARGAAPTAKAQQAEIQAISDALGDRPLLVRSLDAGADKPLDFLDQAPEDNPALGVRGIRLSFARPELLDEQLLAILQVESVVRLQLMLPMVSQVDEVLRVKERLAALRAQHDIDRMISLGIMIETPAAALRAERFARHVDFFSIGTNDLTQYTLCADRLEPALATHLDTLDPAVLALIDTTARAAIAAGIEVSVCGAAAADRLAVPLLLGFGINKLSVPASAVGRLKARLRGLDTATCRTLADEALVLDSAFAVRERVREHLEES